MSEKRTLQFTFQNFGILPHILRFASDPKTAEAAKAVPPMELAALHLFLGASMAIEATRDDLLRSAITYATTVFGDDQEVQNHILQSLGFNDPSEIEHAKARVAAEQKYLEAAQTQLNGDTTEAMEAIRRFCERVERGEVQSVKSYLEFQYALGTPWKPGCACPDHNPVRREGSSFALLCPTCKKEWERFSNFVKPD